MNACCEKLLNDARRLGAWVEEKGWNPLALAIRLVMADVFFSSGKLKLEDLLTGNWAHTVGVFRDATPVPFLPAEIAAPMAMLGEVGLSALLALGLFARFGALGLIVMTGVIELTLRASDLPHQVSTHVLWALLLAVILVKGAGAWSADGWWNRKKSH